MEQGTTYLMFGANGKNMVPIQHTGLKLGQVVSYGDCANPTQRAVVIEAEGGAYGQKCIFLEDFHTSTVSTTTIDAPGGWCLENEIMTPEAVREVERQAAQAAEKAAQARQAAEEEGDRRREAGRKQYESLKPAWAKAVILAELQVDKSDSMTDYFATSTARRVFLAWSRTERNNFAEMRKAALLLPETAHLGPGLDMWKVAVVCAQDIQSSGAWRSKGQFSHWHSDLDGAPGTNQHKHFSTKAEAEAYVAQAGEPYPIVFDGKEARFTWDIFSESYEHRDHGAGCRGYVLGARDYSNGWTVRKQALNYDGYVSDMWNIFGDPDETTWALAKPQETPRTPEAQRFEAEPAPGTGTDPGGVTVTENEEKNGVEIRFPSKPSVAVLDSLKAHGWRWSRHGGCWYHKRTDANREFAQFVVNLS